jgi:molybdopterin/thiamine biosynthesis adenylyltransferase/rhodanese-related sulfurtransferase
MLPELNREEIIRYSRHLLLPEVGIEGQRKLKAASVLIIGAGGLGSPVALYLAAAGVGHIGLVDYDVVDLTNLQRQVIHGTQSMGKLKVESARHRMLELNPGIQVDAFPEPFTSTNALQIASAYEVIIDGSDNFPTRYLTNDLCVLSGKPNIYAAIYRFDGQVSVFDARRGPCYRCLFPEPPPPGSVPTCAEGGVLGVLPGTIGTLQATEALKLLLGIGQPLIGKLLLFNALDLSFEYIRLRKNPGCNVCGEYPKITGLIDYDAFCGVSGINQIPVEEEDDLEITAVDLAEQMHTAHPPHLIDVREPPEQQICSIAGAELIPLGELSSRLSELDNSEVFVVFCRTGIRSRRALEILRGAGFHQVKHLRGGINAWAARVDPGLPVY